MMTLETPLKLKAIKKLKAGDFVQINGNIFTARDQVYSRIIKGFNPPVDMRDGVVFHCGPLVKRKGSKYEIISAGPTTSSRMDPMQLRFVKRTGIKAIIGKGGVGEDVARGLRKAGCLYFAFTGGAGVLAAQKVERIERVYWKDLGSAEALWVLKMREFGPLVVAIDTHGNNLYQKR